jgi:hypothetical protein
MPDSRIFTANIVAEHVELLREAARRADVEYELGPTFTFTSHGEYQYQFRSVYCPSLEAARALQVSYRNLIAGTSQVPLPGVDSLVILPHE